MAGIAIYGDARGLTLRAACPLGHGMDTRFFSRLDHRRVGHLVEGQRNNGGRYWRIAPHLARSAALASELQQWASFGSDSPLAARTADGGTFLARFAPVGSVLAVACVRADHSARHVQRLGSRRRSAP